MPVIRRAVVPPEVLPEVLAIPVPLDPIIAGLMASRTVQSSVMPGVMTTIMTLYRLPAVWLIVARIDMVMAPRMVPVLLHPVWLWVIRKEERAMEEEFGEAWREYAGRTGCFVPRVRSLLGR